MRIAIADPGLIYAGGHHFDHNLLLARALRAKGANVDIHGFRDATGDAVAAFAACGAAFQRTFALELYPQKLVRSAMSAWLVQAKRSARALAGIQSTPPPADAGWRAHMEATIAALDALSGYDLEFWPTSTPAQAAALATRPPSTRTILGLDGHFRRSGNDGAAALGNAAQALARSRAPVSFGCYDFRVAQFCAPIVHPCPVMRLPSCTDGPAVLRRRTSFVRAGFLGSQRAERGVDAVPELAHALLDLGFSVTIQDGRGVAGRDLSHPNLTVSGFAENFAEAVDACDAVIWPGDATQYQDRPSGVVWQAIACGVPVVMPSNCIPARIALARGAASFFHRPTTGEIAAAAVRLRDAYAEAASVAYARAQAWRAREGSAALAAAILKPELDGFSPDDGLTLSGP